MERESFPIELEESDVDEVLQMSTADIIERTQMISNEIRIMLQDEKILQREIKAKKGTISDNASKIKLNKTLPYLISNVVEILDINSNEEDGDGAVTLVDTQEKGTSAVIKTSSGQTIFLPVSGLIDSSELTPGDLVGVNKDSFLIMDTIPAEYDSRVQAMEVVERPTDQYSDIGGLDKQIRELVEAVVLPLTHKEKFVKLGIRPPKGVLLYGPPGTGKRFFLDSKHFMTFSNARQNFACTSLRRPNKVNFLETCWIATCSDAHRRRCKIGSRRFCTG